MITYYRDWEVAYADALNDILNGNKQRSVCWDDDYKAWYISTVDMNNFHNNSDVLVTISNNEYLVEQCESYIKGDLQEFLSKGGFEASDIYNLLGSESYNEYDYKANYIRTDGGTRHVVVDYSMPSITKRIIGFSNEWLF